METKLLVLGQGINQEIFGDGPFDCVELAYKRYRGQRVSLVSLKPIGAIDGKELFIDPDYLDRAAVKEILKLSLIHI